MTVLHTSDYVDATVNPTFTGAKRLRAWRNAPHAEPSVAPPLDVEYLRAKYGPHTLGQPRVIEGVFSVPCQMRWSAYEKRRNDAINRWINAMAKQGWDWDGGRIRVYPGNYPAHDINSIPILDSREFIARASFRQRNPQVVRIEFRPEWLQPTETGLVRPGSSVR